MTGDQLVLELGHRSATGREDFLVTPSNENAVALIDSWPDWPENIVCLFGDPGVGKSHLAHVWQTVSGAVMAGVEELAHVPVPDLLKTGNVVVETVTELSPECERELFHLVNLVRERNGYLLLTAPCSPARLKIVLPDLASRLRALHCIEMQRPDDRLLGAVLVKLFEDRQLWVPESLISYLVARMERSVDAARNLVQALDETALSGKRPVTRRLAAEVLKRYQSFQPP